MIKPRSRKSIGAQSARPKLSKYNTRTDNLSTNSHESPLDLKLPLTSTFKGAKAESDPQRKEESKFFQEDVTRHGVEFEHLGSEHVGKADQIKDLLE